MLSTTERISIKPRYLLGLFGLVLFGMFLLCRPSAVSAAGGITVTPARLNFALSKDAPSQRITVSITNNYNSAISLAAEFKGIDEDAGVLVPTDDVEATLLGALRLSETSIRLLPHQPYSLTIQLDNAADLAPGGHYATLVLTQQGTANSGLALQAAISLTIFAVKNEGVQPSLKVDGFTTNGWLFKMPSTASLDYRNDGNVHVVPRAEVVVTKPHSLELIRRGVSNQNSVLLLPGKTLHDTVQLNSLGRVWWPTKLQVVVAYRPDGAAKQTLIVRSVWYIPTIYPLGILLIAAAVLWRWRHRKSAATEQTKRLNLVPSLRSASTRTRSLVGPKIAKLRRLRTRRPSATNDSTSAAVIIAPEPVSVKPKLAKKTTARNIKVKEAPPLITLASLEQRTTKVATKKPTKTAKQNSAKPKTASKSIKKPTRSRKKA